MMHVATVDLHKRYTGSAGSVHALRGVSLQLPRRTICAVAGPSGSGKSTLLAMLGGLDAPSEGEVHVGGFALHRLTPAERTRFRAACVGFVFQSNNLIPVLTAAENVALPLTLQALTTRERSRRVEGLLAELGLRREARQRVVELSGGQQQRVAIARALVTEPALVLADEPTAHLDSRTGREVMDVLRTSNRARGTTFVFSTHDPAMEALADAHVTLRDGALVRDTGEEERAESWPYCSSSPRATFFGIGAVPS